MVCLHSGFSLVARMLLGKETLEGDASSFLLGLLLGSTFGFGERARTSKTVANSNFYAEAFLMVGTALGGENVMGLAGSSRLEVLLQCGFVVTDGSTKGVARLHGEVEFRNGGLDDVPLNEGTSSSKTTVEVECSDDGFKGVSEQGGFLSTATLLLSATKKEEVSEANARGYITEVTAADKRGAKASQFALTGGGKAAEEGFCNSKTKDGIANKL